MPTTDRTDHSVETSRGGENRSNGPNFLIFITDQQRADHLGCAGHPVLQTPSIDAIAARGVRFERSYVACPLCQPARATLFTGLTPRGHGVRTNGIPLSPSVPTFVEALRQGGYRTHSVGKLHLRNFWEPRPSGGPPSDLDRMLETRWLWLEDRMSALPANYAGLETADFTGGHGPGIFGNYQRWLRDQDPDGPRLLSREAGEPPPSGAEQSWTMALPSELHYNTWIADRSIDFLRREAAADRPFFLWCSFPDPHHPFAIPRPWSNLYNPDDEALPNRRPGELDDLPPHYRQIFDEALQTSGRRAPTRIRDDQMRDVTAITHGMISMVDQQVGRVMSELERLDLRENTVVVFMSDHGDMLGDHWIINKGPFHFDGLLRVPTIWSWPGHFGEGVVSEALTNQLDFAPTVLDLAGVPIPEGIASDPPEAARQLPAWPGASLGQLLAGQASKVHDQLLVENDEDYLGLRLRTLITEDYQITAYPGQPYGELFDRGEDPGQLHNLWNDQGYQGVKSELLIRLMAEIVRTDNVLPRRTSHA